MNRYSREIVGSAGALLVLSVLILPGLAEAITEPKTKTEYPDSVVLEMSGGEVELMATGVALREKTMLKVDVYTIVSYVEAGVEFGDDPAADLVDMDIVKQIQMNLRRGFSRDKLIGAFREVIEKNYEDMSTFAADMAVFEGYFTRDAQDGDVILFTYVPGNGLVTVLNGEEKGLITNFEFCKALWTVWFGKKPANGGMKKNLVAALTE